MARIIDVIDAPNQGANELVIRVPEEGAGDFRLGSQVIVRESQRAIFYRDGHSLDLFDPGRHTITTMNLPLLSDLLRLATSGKDIFTAEVYFVNMREITDLKWGTPQPISLRDSDLGLVRLRAFGQYTIQINDPKRFVDEIVGTQGIYTTTQIEDYLRNAVISRLTDLLGETMSSIFDLPQQFNEISTQARSTIDQDFRAVGIALRQFVLVSISPTDETAKAIDERASMGAIGNVDAYMKFKTARALGDAAQQSGGAGDGLGLGAGIGMGAGMAGMIAETMSGAQNSVSAASNATPSTTSDSPAVMTLDEAATYLRVTPADVQTIINSGELKARKIGAEYRISRDAIDAFLSG